MKIIFFLVAFLALFSIAFSAVEQIPKPAGKPGDCWSKETGPMKTDEVRTIKGSCSKAECHKDGAVSVVSCGVIAAPNGVTEIDLSKPYPECCPQPK